jgi:hypothetical protein
MGALKVKISSPDQAEALADSPVCLISNRPQSGSVRRSPSTRTSETSGRGGNTQRPPMRMSPSSKQQFAVAAAMRSNGSCCLLRVLAYAVALPCVLALKLARTAASGRSASALSSHKSASSARPAEARAAPHRN